MKKLFLVVIVSFCETSMGAFLLGYALGTISGFFWEWPLGFVTFVLGVMGSIVIAITHLEREERIPGNSYYVFLAGAALGLSVFGALVLYKIYSS